MKLIFILMFLLMVGMVAGDGIISTTTLETSGVYTLYYSLGDDFVVSSAVTNVQINEYTFTSLPQGTIINYEDGNLVLTVDYNTQKIGGSFFEFKVGENTFDYISFGEQSPKFKVYLPSKNSDVAYNGYNFVNLNNENLEFSFQFNSDIFGYFSLGKDDELIMDSADVYNVEVVINLENNDKIKDNKIPIKVCSELDKSGSLSGGEQYYFGDFQTLDEWSVSSSNDNEKLGLDGETSFEVKLESNACEITSCKYYGNLESTGGIVTLRCGESYPTFEITNLPDLQGLVFDENEWTCAGNCRDALGDGIVKLYSVNKVPITLINSEFESYSGNELEADKFYVGVESNGYLVKPNNRKASFKSLGENILEMTLKDGGEITIPEGTVSDIYSRKTNLKLEEGKEYRIIFRNSESSVMLEGLDCCINDQRSSWINEEEKVGRDSFETYGCQNVKDRNGFLMFKGSSLFEPEDSLNECRVVNVGVADDKTEPEPAAEPVVVGMNDIDVGEIDIATGCGSDVEKGDWGYYCGIRSELDPCFSLVTTGMEGGLWTQGECSTSGECDFNMKKEGFYCCSPDVAKIKPYAFNGDDATDALGLNRYSDMYKGLDWNRVNLDCIGKVSMLTDEAKVLLNVPDYAVNGDDCSELWGQLNAELKDDNIGYTKWYTCDYNSPSKKLVCDLDYSSKIWYESSSECGSNTICDTRTCSAYGCDCSDESEEEVVAGEEGEGCDDESGHRMGAPCNVDTSEDAADIFYYVSESGDIGSSDTLLGKKISGTTNIVCGVDDYDFWIELADIRGTELFDAIVNKFNRQNEYCSIEAATSMVEYNGDYIELDSEFKSICGTAEYKFPNTDKQCKFKFSHYSKTGIVFDVICDMQILNDHEGYECAVNYDYYPNTFDNDIPNLKVAYTYGPYIYIGTKSYGYQAPEKEKSFMDWIFKAEMVKKLL